MINTDYYLLKNSLLTAVEKLYFGSIEIKISENNSLIKEVIYYQLDTTRDIKIN